MKQRPWRVSSTMCMYLFPASTHSDCCTLKIDENEEALEIFIELETVWTFIRGTADVGGRAGQ